MKFYNTSFGKMVTCVIILAGGIFFAKYISPWLAFILAEFMCSIYEKIGIL